MAKQLDTGAQLAMGERVAARIEKHRPKAGPWPAAGTVATCAAVGIHRAGTAQWTGTARAAVVDSLSLYMPREDAEAAVPHDLGADDDGPASNLDGAERAIILEGTAYRLDGVPVAHEVIAGAPTWQNANGTWHRLQPGADAPELLNRDGQWEDAGHPWAEHLEVVQAEHGRLASQLENDERIATLRASGGADTLYGPSSSPFDFSSADPVEAAAAAEWSRRQQERRDGGRPLVPLDPAQIRADVATDLADRGQRERIDAELTDLHAERATLRRGTDPSNPATRERIDARQRAIDATAAELTAERAAMRQLPEDVGVEDMTDEQLSAIYGATMHAPGAEVPA